MTHMTTLAGKDLIGTIGKMLMQDMDVGKLIDWIDNAHDNTMDWKVTISSLVGGFKYFFFTPTWGNDPIWLIFFRWVETTN